MNSWKEDIINFWGRALFVALFFLLVSSFYEKSCIQDRKPFQYALSSALDTNSMNAVSVDNIVLPSFEKNWVSFIDKSNFIFFNEKIKIFADNQRTVLKIISLQKRQRLIKTIILSGFYRNLFPIDNDELPDLS